MWTVDFKGEFLTGDRHYCYPLTLRDGFSRYVLRCDALTAHTLAVTRPCLERAFAEYASTARAQQRRFTRFCVEYNQERPHEALAQTVPAQHYQASPRSLPRQLAPLEYPGHTEVRRVDQNGYVSWRRPLRPPLFVSAALAGEPVAFEEVDDGIWTVIFASLVLGRFDERRHQIHPIAAITGGRSASGAGSAPNSKNEERR